MEVFVQLFENLAIFKNLNFGLTLFNAFFFYPMHKKNTPINYILYCKKFLVRCTIKSI